MPTYFKFYNRLHFAAYIERFSIEISLCQRYKKSDLICKFVINSKKY
jgi:hypothetical protein